jgi:hypothetical protein
MVKIQKKTSVDVLSFIQLYIYVHVQYIDGPASRLAFLTVHNSCRIVNTYYDAAH